MNRRRIVRSRATNGRNLGFTLIELLSVMATLGVLAGLGTPRLLVVVNRAKVVRAIMDIKAIQADLDAMEAINQPLPHALSEIGRGSVLDPWGRPYEYMKYPPGSVVPNGARRDKLFKPLNSSYDLYSVGPDGDSHMQLNKSESLDDVVRALDGGYIGVASRF